MMNPDQAEKGRSRWIVGCALAWLVGALPPAWLSFRYLYADGAAYLIEILSKKTFFFPWPGRQIAQVLDQWPAVLAVTLGTRDFRFVASCLGAGMMLMPALIHGLSLTMLLRRGWPTPAAVYLVMLWLLQLYPGLMSVAESHVAAAVFLLAIVMLFTDRPARKANWFVLGLVGLLSFRLYEFWFFYAGLFVLLLGGKLKAGWTGMNGRSRALALAVIGIMLASTVVNLLRLLGDNPNQISFMQMMSGTTLPVYLALITAWFLGFCGHAWLSARQPPGWFFRWLPPVNVRQWGLMASLALLLALSAIQFDTMVRYSYPFRVINLALPVIYAGWLAVAGDQKSAPDLPAGFRTLLAVLTLVLLIHETRLTMDWNPTYQDWVASVSGKKGAAAFVPQPPDTRVAQTWIYPWAHSAHSFEVQALRAGRVTAVGYDPGAAFNPYGPGHEERLRALAACHGIPWDAISP